MGLLEVLIVVLLIFWLVGVVAVPVTGGAIHILLVIVLVLVVVRLLTGRTVV